MAKRENSLEDYEVSLIKAMLKSNKYESHQKILAYFTRPSRSVNPARITEIKSAMHSNNAEKYAKQPIASEADLKAFLKAWPNIDPDTGLHRQDDELIIKSREAMLFAVQAYNNPTTYFKSEMFIVSAVIGWLYLLHYHYKKNNIDIVDRDKNGIPKQINGKNKLFGLPRCLKDKACPLDKGTENNLNFLIGIRNQIEHEKTSNIDDAISAKLQQCCLNYNRFIKELVGESYGLDKKLSLALQFLYIDPMDKVQFNSTGVLSPSVSSFITKFEEDMSEAEYNDPNYACRIAMFRKNENNKGNADVLCEIVSSNSEMEESLNVVFKDREPEKFLPSKIVSIIQNQEYGNFRMHEHTKLWKDLDGKNPKKSYGTNIAGHWYWYQSWLDKVLEHVKNNEDQYKTK